jgi:fumarate reductase subunit D
MKNKITLLFIVLVTLSSCGVISKARYGNGLKINLDFGKDTEKNVVAKNSKAKKKSTVKIQNTQNQVEETTVFSTEIASTISPFTNTENETSNTNSTLNQFPKKPILEKIEKKKAILKTYLKPNQVKLSNDDRPMERNAKWAAILFYGGMILALVIPIIPFLMSVLGILLASFSLGVIKTSNYAYRGYGLARSVLIVFFAAFLLFLLLIFLLGGLWY